MVTVKAIKKRLTALLTLKIYRICVMEDNNCEELSPNLVNIIIAYFTTWKIMMESVEIDETNEAPQGTVLSPALSNNCYNDVLESLRE